MRNSRVTENFDHLNFVIAGIELRASQPNIYLLFSEIAQNLAPLVPTLTVLTLVSATMVSQLSLSEDALSDVPMLTNAKLI